jgi:hypothetical protein
MVKSGFNFEIYLNSVTLTPPITTEAKKALARSDVKITGAVINP